MFIVGIDISKRSHMVCVIDSEGRTVYKPFSIRNNCSGCSVLLERLRKLKERVSLRHGINGPLLAGSLHPSAERGIPGGARSMISQPQFPQAETDFFLLPPRGSFSNIVYEAVSRSGITAKS